MQMIQREWSSRLSACLDLNFLSHRLLKLWLLNVLADFDHEGEFLTATS
jgi:hypothetical protein